MMTKSVCGARGSTDQVQAQDRSWRNVACSASKISKDINFEASPEQTNNTSFFWAIRDVLQLYRLYNTSAVFGFAYLRLFNTLSDTMAPKRHAASSAPAQATSSATSRSVSPAPPAPVQTKVSSSSGSAVPGLTSSSSTQEIILHIWKRYLTQTPQRTLLLDAFMAFLVLVGAVQFVYCVLAGNYVCLRLPVYGIHRPQA
jgi:hypothetical protein